ncbi:MAG: SxtJ family membrane protein [Planctomycetota bacterium]
MFDECPTRQREELSRGELITFAAGWAVAFSAMGLLAFVRGHAPLGIGLWIAAIAIPALGWLAPPLLQGMYRVLHLITCPIGVAVSFVALALAYYLVLTPIGLLRRWSGHDAMQRRFDRHADTYWISRTPDDDVDRYFRQF